MIIIIQAIIIGAGPTGLSAAYELQKNDVETAVFDAAEQIGGIAKTVEFDGFRFDLGGHRFFTKISEIEKLWEDLVGDRWVLRPRQSRIMYQGKLFDYPLQPLSALRKLGPRTSLAIAASYIARQIRPQMPEESFEAWVSNRFGTRLYEIFFKTYTEKVWGISCSQISADWAAQRIRKLSLWQVLTEPFRRRSGQHHSLIRQFHYPPLGPQEMWDELAERIREAGARIHTRHRVTELHLDDDRVQAVTIQTPQTDRKIVETDAVISTMPLNELILALRPQPTDDVLNAARALRYRGYLTVCLIIDSPPPLEDNWIYIHSPDIRMGRLQMYENWSPQMSPEAGATGFGLEYFAWESDDLWQSDDQDIVQLGIDELDRLDIVDVDRVRSGHVVRSPHAYPVYDIGYRQYVDTIRGYLQTIDNLHPCGRAGLHRYNNMDHAMLTGKMAARNLAVDEENDVWNVAEEAEYLEQAADTDP